MLQGGKILASLRVNYEHQTTGAITTSNRSATSNAIHDGNWHHVVVRFNTYGSSNNYSVVAQVHIDGALQDSNVSSVAARTLPEFDTTGNIAIANNRNNTINANLKYNDAIDDILIYNRELTTQEIQNIGNVGNFCFVPGPLSFSGGSITETSVDIDLPASGTYEIAYHKLSEPFSNAITTPQGSGSITVNGLTPSTAYRFYIRKNCTSAMTSGWSFSRIYRTSGPIYVNASATGNNDGSSWANAYTDLRSSIFLGGIDKPIWVASGTYKPHASVNRGLNFLINKANLKIYGGFAGTETSISQRIVGTNETILSGDYLGNDNNNSNYPANYSNASRADNNYYVVNIVPGGNNLLLDGFTISGAHNNSSGSAKGAAIIKHKTISKLTVKNCIIKDNVSRNDNAGLLAEFELNNTSVTKGELIVENCKFINNMSRFATGLYSFVRSNTYVDISVSNSLFDNNLVGDLNSSSIAGISGSASWFRMLGNSANATLKLTNNTYVNNIDEGLGKLCN